MEPVLSPMSASLVAGGLAGIAGLLAFLVIHHLWIKPIWFIAIPGVLVAWLGGMAVGWAYRELHATLAHARWTTLSVVALWAAILLPSVLLSFTHGPLFDVATARVPPGRGTSVAIRFVLELLVTTALAGAAAGWLLGRSRRAALVMALAGFCLAIGPGHNIPMFGTHPYALKGMAILFAVIAIASVVLVRASAWLTQA